MMDKPVLLLLFNRPHLSSQVFKAVREARPHQLFIAVDGPRPQKPADEQNCARCRDIAAAVDWPCEVHTLFRRENLGCLAAVKGAIDWFFKNVPEGIILEDDCVPDPTFFQYCGGLLDHYRQDKRVLTIGGSNMGHPPLESSYGFTPFMNMWGWATWRDRLSEIDYSCRNLTSFQNRVKLFWALQRGRPSFWHLDYRWYLHWLKSFSENAAGISNHWDLPWIYHGLMQRTVSIYPTVNLIKNIGFGDVATHTGDGRSPLAELPTSPMTFPLKHPQTIRYSKIYELECIRRRWSSFEPSLWEDARTVYYYSKMWCLRKIKKQGTT